MACSILSRLASSPAELSSPKTLSISSSVLPAVSGTKKYTQKSESRQNTAKKTYAPKPVFSTSGGVMRPMMKLKSQLQEVENLSKYVLAQC